MGSEGLPAGATARVITVSDRSHGGARHDSSGPLLAGLLRDQGFEVGDVVVVPDEVPEIVAALRSAIADEVDVCVTTGGTGFAPRDVTPEATRTVLDKEAPGLAEAVRQYNREQIPTTILSRGVAGVAAGTLVVNLPGSTGGVRDGMAVLAPVIGHAVAQLHGEDH
ncbi:MAG TPA: MogA/MoaB family molybdenum cofactor biosynthesis protein [Mycobacteriales bacterium]|jgi:molybdenum cofactor biosynthesis protein B|nr:MogA/MoaB family molybdenum cofactor biosynthesis protein [Mycobacteriales bacterium]